MLAPSFNGLIQTIKLRMGMHSDTGDRASTADAKPGGVINRLMYPVCSAAALESASAQNQGA